MSTNGKPSEHWAIIGSSPCLLFEAIHLGYAGHKVTVIEKNSSIGGSWTTSDVGNWKGVDLGPHSMPLDHRGLRFFDEIDIKYHLDRNSDVVALNRSVFGINTISSKYKLVAGSVNNSLHVSKLRLAIRFLVAVAIETCTRLAGRGLKKDIHNIFPKYGLERMLDKIRTFMDDANVDVILNEEAQRVDFEASGSKVNVATKSGQMLSFDKIIFSSFTDVGEVAVDGVDQTLPEHIPSIQTQLQLTMKDSMAPMDGGRCKVPKGDPILRFMKDLTLYLPNSLDRTDAERVFVLFVKNEISTDQQGVDEIMARLKGHGIVSSDAEALAWKWIFTDRKYRKPEDWTGLSDAAGNLFRFINTHPFGHSINDNVDRWLTTYRHHHL